MARIVAGAGLGLLVAAVAFFAASVSALTRREIVAGLLEIFVGISLVRAGVDLCALGIDRSREGGDG